MAPFTRGTISAASVTRIGAGSLFIGDLFKTDGTGMTRLGATEGDATLTMPQEENVFNIEQTGSAIHGVELMDGPATFAVSLVMGDPDLWAKIRPSGTKGIGTDEPYEPVTFGMVFMPNSDMGAKLYYNSAGVPPGWNYTAPGASPEEGPTYGPKNAVWFWKCYATHDAATFRRSGGGKTTIGVTFHALHDHARPAGYKQGMIGDPYLATPEPIAVKIAGP